MSTVPATQAPYQVSTPTQEATPTLEDRVKELEARVEHLFAFHRSPGSPEYGAETSTVSETTSEGTTA